MSFSSPPPLIVASKPVTAPSTGRSSARQAASHQGSSRAPPSVKSPFPSNPPSKRSRSGAAEPNMSNAAALTNMSGAIHHIGDVLKEALTSSSPVIPTSDRATVATESAPPADYLVTAMNNMNNNIRLSVDVRDHISMLIMNDESFRKVYATATHPNVRYMIAMRCYEQGTRCSVPPPPAPDITTSSESQSAVVYTAAPSSSALSSSSFAFMDHASASSAFVPTGYTTPFASVTDYTTPSVSATDYATPSAGIFGQTGPEEQEADIYSTYHGSNFNNFYDSSLL
jgi:hypothetical protein